MIAAGIRSPCLCSAHLLVCILMTTQPAQREAPYTYYHSNVIRVSHSARSSIRLGF
jgi:hypothetical protein